MEIKNISGDIFSIQGDILIFPANPKPVIGGSLDGQVFKKAGQKELLDAREKIGEISYGESCITESYHLKSYKWLIHAVTPRYQENHAASSINTLKKCYIYSLKLAESKHAKTVVSALLGAGASRFPYEKAVAAANQAFQEYQTIVPESCIESVTLVQYDRVNQYQLIIKCNDLLKEASRLLAQIEGFEEYIHKDSEIGKLINNLTDILCQNRLQKVSALFERYQAELADYCEKTYCSPDDYNYEIFKELVVFPEGMTNEKLAMKIFEPDPTKISKIRNLKKSNADTKALGFLKKRMNVLRLGLGLELSLYDICRLMWCRGHAFPVDEFDNDLISMYIPDKNYEEALAAWHERVYGVKPDR